MSSHSRIRTAIVGLGRSGWGIHGKALKDRSDYELVAVADPDQARLREFGEKLGCPGVPTIDEILAKSDAELVVVASPNHLHVEDGMKVLESGRHCVLEKPVALNHADARRLAECAERKGRKVFAHHQRRFSDEFRFLKEVIESGILGRIFEIRLAWGGYTRRNDWQTLVKYNGGMLNNHGPHALDLILNLADSPVETLTGDRKHVKDAGDADDHVHLFMKTARGQILDVMTSSCVAIPLPRTVLLGANGTLVAPDDKTAKLRYYDPAAAEPIEVIDRLAPPGVDLRPQPLPWIEEEREIKPATPGGDFYDNVAGVLRRNEPMVVSLESAVEVVRILEMAHGQGRL